MTMNVDQIRAEFPGLRRDVAFLDNAATTQICAASIEAMTTYWQSGRSNVGRGLYPLAEESMKEYETARSEVAKFVNAESDRCIFTKSVTEGLNMIAFGLQSTLKEGDEILVSPFEHHANLLPWRRIARERGVSIQVMPMTDHLELDMAGSLAMINNRTKIVATTLVSNVLGTTVPVQELSERAHQVGAMLIVDAAQAVAHQPVSMKEFGADAIVFGAHKMYGPAGIAAVVCSKTLIDSMEPMIVGGGMVDAVGVENETFRSGVQRFEGGSPNVEGAIGFAAAVRFAQSIGAVQTESMIGLLRSGLRVVDKVRVLRPESSRSIVAFTVDGAHPHDVADLLGKEGVCVRAGNMCAAPLVAKISPNGVIRVSIAAYTDEADVRRLLEVLPRVIGVLV
jgi:cysteine desulfurase/selenocysteine lyase